MWQALLQMILKYKNLFTLYIGKEKPAPNFQQMPSDSLISVLLAVASMYELWIMVFGTEYHIISLEHVNLKKNKTKIFLTL